MAEAADENILEQQSHQQVDDQCNGSERSASPVENDAFLFFSYLEEIEGRIEYLRRHAIALSQERDSLLLVLSQLKEESMTSPLTKDEFQEICVNMERLSTRCKTVDIKVQTVRNPEQQEAFEKVNSLVNEVEKSCSLTDEKNNAYKRAKTFLNACSSEPTESGAIDFKFQGMILDCVIEDQKYIRYRLESIVRNSLHPPVHSSRAEPSDNNDSSENCIKPSAIASAVKESPHFEICDDSLPESPVKIDNSISDEINQPVSETSLNGSLHSCEKSDNTASMRKDPSLNSCEKVDDETLKPTNSQQS